VFELQQASSRGNPQGILLTFSQQPDANAALTDPASYFIDPGLTITSVTTGPRAGSVWLNTAENITEGTAYTVIVLGAVTSGGAALTVDTQSFTHGAGYEARPIHIGHNKGRENGDGVLNTTRFKRGLFSNADNEAALEGNPNGFFEDPLPDTGANERFSARIFGVLNITAAGLYRFACSSDDVGNLFLSTDADPAHKVAIAREPSWNGSRQYATTDRRNAASPENQSAPINLAAGRYYIEYTYAEGGGGNNGSATWMPPGGPAFSNGEDPMPASAFSLTRYFNGAERGELFDNLGQVTIVTQPTAQTVTALQPVTFKVKVDGTPAYAYQWRRNGQPVDGATEPTYTLAVTLPGDDGAIFSVSVNNEFSTVTSTGVRLTVINPLPPHVLAAVPDTSFRTVVVKFDNRVQLSSAQNAANYTIPGLTVTAAVVDSSGSNVVLTTSQQADGANYNLTVRDVRELTGLNAIVPNPTTLSFYALAFSPGFVVKDFFLNYSSGVDQLAANAGGILSHPTFTCYSNLWELNDRDLYEGYGRWRAVVPEHRRRSGESGAGRGGTRLGGAPGMDRAGFGWRTRREHPGLDPAD
jgi:hypothetical protein